MRIVGGNLRGKKLLLPEDKRIRPTSDRTREALFNILGHDRDMRGESGPLPARARALDLFAGTGALGLEALSRGAAHVTFMDNHPDSLKLIGANIRHMNLSRQADILRRDVASPGIASEPYDLVLMDPPYGADLALPSIQALKMGGWLRPGSIIVIELGAKEEFALPNGFDLLKDRTYGAARLIFLRTTADQCGGTS
ncbi:16S rRNA (guanine(966)-N(2))-methyltransferase RsmD [uncultured Sneathiella sp.]|uniref:16S rRNA (guanine(966)-N(2))-methyltransferase RsmD n=1 Tax=uncultured Sneathiella sp. TaxID=879315 RepID=UPI0030EDFA67|tara:strand:+ start:834 stop:1424 length:591 start_codon:yes stop_codon:yes gene_type:complete